MAFYPWFTGRGVGYDPDEEKLTGEEKVMSGTKTRGNQVTGRTLLPWLDNNLS